MFKKNENVFVYTFVIKIIKRRGSGDSENFFKKFGDLREGEDSLSRKFYIVSSFLVVVVVFAVREHERVRLESRPRTVSRRWLD